MHHQEKRNNLASKYLLLITAFALALLSTSSAQSSDSIAVIVKNSKTGRPIDWGYSLRIYTDKDTFVTKSQLPKSIFADFEKERWFEMRLEVYDHYFRCFLSVDEFMNASRLIFNLVLDKNSNDLCNRVYYTTTSGDGILQTVYNDENSPDVCSHKTTNYQSLEIINSIYEGFGLTDEADWIDKYYGEYSQYNGVYHAQVDSLTEIVMELADTSMATLYLKRSGAVVFTAPATWLFNSSYNTIELPLPSPIITSLNVVPNNCSFEVEDEKKGIIGLYHYSVLNGRIEKRKLFEFKRK